MKSSVPRTPADIPSADPAGNRAPSSGPTRDLSIHVILFVTTIATTIIVGSNYAGNLFRQPEFILTHGIPFSITLMAILLAHEMGHYMASRHHGVRASLPYFIPVPFGIGTFGAFIKMRSAIRERGVLLIIGAAGPICGMILAVPAFLYGLQGAEVVDAVDPGALRLGDSLLTYLLTYVSLGPIPEGKEVLFNSVCYAGWLGMFITSLNLLPAGQLDGGHVVYAFFGTRHAVISHVTYLLLVILGIWGDPHTGNPVWLCLCILLTIYAVSIIFMGPPTWRKRIMYMILVVGWVIVGAYMDTVSATTIWLIWAALLYSFRLDHPPTRDLFQRLSWRRRIVGWMAVLIFVLTFIPRPFIIAE